MDNSAIAADVTLRTGGDQIAAHLYEDGSYGMIDTRRKGDEPSDSRYIYRRFPDAVALLAAWRDTH